MAKALSPQNNLSKKIFIDVALLDYCRMANVSEADIDKLYEKVEMLNNEAFNDEEALNIVIENGLDEITSRDKLKDRLEQMKSKLAEKIFEYYAIEGNSENAGLIAAALTAAGANKKEASVLAGAICEKRLQEPFKNDQRLADRLVGILFSNQKKLKEKLSQEFRIYQDTRTANPVIEQIKPDILEYIGGVAKSNVFEYETRKEQYDFRQKLRGDFSRAGGIRENFVKLSGLLAENGMKLVRGEAQSSNFDAFSGIVRNLYGDDYAAELDKALGVPDNTPESERDAARKERYEAKSREMYLKLMAGILTKKMEYDDQAVSSYGQAGNYGVYVSTVENKFIRKMVEGVVDVRSLCLENAVDNTPAASFREEKEMYRKSLDETAERQIVSVHHKLPLGAAYDVHDRLYGKVLPEEKLKNSCALVNNAGNMCLVIGKELHQRLEARGSYVQKAAPDSSILQAEGSADVLRLKMPDYLKKGLEKYLKSGKVGLSVSLNFSDHALMRQERQKLQVEKSVVGIDQKYARYV